MENFINIMVKLLSRRCCKKKIKRIRSSGKIIVKTLGLHTMPDNRAPIEIPITYKTTYQLTTINNNNKKKHN